jgi:hypothetical protein
VALDAWNLVLILLVLSVITLSVYAPLVYRAVFGRSEVPMKRINAWTKLWAEAALAVTEMLRRS